MEDVASSVESVGFLGDGGQINGVTIVGQSLVINVYRRDALGNFSFINQTISIPSCTRVGFDNSYSGMTTADAIEISGLVGLVLITAWAIKSLRRGF